MLIPQDTDTHIKAAGRLVYRKVDSADKLANCVAQLNRLAPRPDIVLLTGDLVDPNRPNQGESGFDWLAWLSQRRPLWVRLDGAFAVLALGLGVFLMTRPRPSQPEPLAVVTRCLGAKTAPGSHSAWSTLGARSAHLGRRHGGGDDSKRCPDPTGRPRYP